jgi:2',3'-cyclic-nucleotide 2'-phosphodiesterase (5'-nucleotidase family)
MSTNNVNPAGLRQFSLLLLLALAGACQAPSSPDADTAGLRELTVLYTNDEHGWMEGMQPGQGAAGLYRLWQEREGYHPDGPFLVLSGGDNWTGPAVSTWVEGQSMVEVMNAMHYDASAVGNHEFDFGLEALAGRLREAEFPYLSANTRWRDDGRVPTDLGILPFTLSQVNGLTVGIIGLTTTSTPRTTNPRHVARLQFDDYEQALRATVPELVAAEPDLLIVIAHVCMAALEPLAERVADLGIALMGGGHCNESIAKRVGNTVLLGGGYHFTAYAKARLLVDSAGGGPVNVHYEVVDNVPASQDPAIAARVGAWQDQFRDILAREIAWSGEQLEPVEEPVRQAIIESWLVWDPAADIAITNAGGLRAPLPAGVVTFNDVVNMMPFESNIVAVQVPGSAVRRALAEGGRPIVAGLGREGDDWLFTGTGEPLADAATYRVLINSFMYDGGDNFQALREADPDGFDTGIHYREPFVELLESLQSGPDKPLVLADLLEAIAP